jgi:hypothetical protein
MNIRVSQFTVASLAIVFTQAVFAQGFQNLNFENGVFVPIDGDPYGRVQWDQAMPGWQGYVGGMQMTSIIPNGVPIGLPGQTPFIAIIAPPMGSAPEGSSQIAFGAATDGLGNRINVALSQTGEIPSQAMSLLFLANYAPAVLLDGRQLAVVTVGTGPLSSTLFGVDVTSFAGQTLELRFEPGLGIDYLDNIQFSSTGIPEPSAFSLFLLGSLTLGWHRRRNYRT